MATLLKNASLIDQLLQSSIAPEALFPMLAMSQAIPNLLGESIIAQAINPIVCSAEETAQACTHLYQQWGLTSAEQQTEWRSIQFALELIDSAN